MTPMGTPDGGNARRMARGGEPVVDCGADAATLDRRIAWTMMTGHEKDDAVAAGNRSFQRAVDRLPGAVEIHAV